MTSRDTPPIEDHARRSAERSSRSADVSSACRNASTNASTTFTRGPQTDGTSPALGQACDHPRALRVAHRAGSSPGFQVGADEAVVRRLDGAWWDVDGSVEVSRLHMGLSSIQETAVAINTGRSRVDQRSGNGSIRFIIGTAGATTDILQ